MLNAIQTATQPARNPRNEKRLWNHGDRHSVSLGCTSCLDRGVCGGLQVESAPFDCLGYCCGNPAGCDVVCRNKPDEFAQRVREIDGFSLDNVPRAPLLGPPDLPALIPTIFHGDKRHGSFGIARMACLPLYKVICREDGKTRFANAEALAQGFGIARATRVLLTGTAVDPPLERWWSLGIGRIDAIRALRDLQVSMVTTPNFSLFTDQPRWDDMHSMKRIALVYEEFLREGMPAALHVNARTERDWERWIDFAAQRTEVTHLAYEFGTGAGWGDRMDWHAEQLAHFGQTVSRPLHLVVRGGGRVLPLLIKSFAKVTVLETSAFLKSVKRQRAQLNGKGQIEWTPSPTGPAQMLDDLFAENWRTVKASYAGVFGELAVPLEAVG